MRAQGELFQAKEAPAPAGFRLVAEAVAPDAALGHFPDAALTRFV